MFEFSSKPVQVLSDPIGMYVLCQDGSLWVRDFGEFLQVACYKPPVKEKKEKGESHYTAEFIEFWEEWNKHIKNGSTKRSSFLSYKKLTNEEKDALIASVPVYARTNDNAQYLKRCETYINQKHWESLSSMHEMAKTFIPAMTDSVWDVEIFNQDTGITESARKQVERFGMDKNEAWGLLNDT